VVERPSQSQLGRASRLWMTRQYLKVVIPQPEPDDQTVTVTKGANAWGCSRAVLCARIRRQLLRRDGSLRSLAGPLFLRRLQRPRNG
jgi:hypothetical protein